MHESCIRSARIDCHANRGLIEVIKRQAKEVIATTCDGNLAASRLGNRYHRYATKPSERDANAACSNVKPAVCSI